MPCRERAEKALSEKTLKRRDFVHENGRVAPEIVIDQAIVFWKEMSCGCRV